MSIEQLMNSWNCEFMELGLQVISFKYFNIW